MLNRDADNWTEIARTNREGVFIQSDTTKEIKYRFDGHLETEWMLPLSDTVITQLTANNEFRGRRCVVPEGTTLVIQNQKLLFRCEETIIEGNIVAFPGNSYNGRGAGSVDILGNVINIKGKIHLAGEQGSGGSNGIDGQGGREGGVRRCTAGGHGGPGGNGGVIHVYALKKLNLENEAEQLIANAGAGGWGGRGGRSPNGNHCSNGNAGAAGSSGRIQVISPARPLQ
jgi:hypothetical protein